MGRKGVWGGREPGAEGSMPALGAEGGHLQGRKLVWGGKEYGALRLGTPRHTNLTLTLKLRHFSARREASTLFIYISFN